MTLGELVMGQALHDLRLVFADENDNACSSLPDGLSAALEMRLESPANGSETVTAQALCIKTTQVTSALQQVQYNVRSARRSSCASRACL